MMDAEMKTSSEATGKTIDEAKLNALKSLDISPEQIDTVQCDVEVLDEPSSGFLGFGKKFLGLGKKEVRVRVTLKKETPIERAENFLKKVCQIMKLDATFEINEIKKDIDDEAAQQDQDEEKSVEFIEIRLHGEELGILIGKHGQTLDSLQYLVNLTANKDRTQDHVHFILDVENYRQRRAETLKALAIHLAEKALRNNEKIVLEPMNRHERKIIHMALHDDRRIRTTSAGDEPFRKVVIEPSSLNYRRPSASNENGTKTYASRSRSNRW